MSLSINPNLPNPLGVIPNYDAPRRSYLDLAVVPSNDSLQVLEAAIEFAQYDLVQISSEYLLYGLIQYSNSCEGSNSLVGEIFDRNNLRFSRLEALAQDRFKAEEKTLSKAELKKMHNQGAVIATDYSTEIYTNRAWQVLNLASNRAQSNRGNSFEPLDILWGITSDRSSSAYYALSQIDLNLPESIRRNIESYIMKNESISPISTYTIRDLSLWEAKCRLN